MCDFKGDRSNGIVTVPVAFGNHVSWVLSSILINTNILFQSAALIYLYNLQIGLLFFILSSPALLRSYEIYQAKYTKDSVMLAVEETSKQLFFSLLYFLLLTVL
jgi:1,4-dihydroxy-2-naphthoate octaprenyltransferase